MSSIHLVVNTAFCVGFSFLVVPAYRKIKNLIIKEKDRASDCIINSKCLKDSSLVALEKITSRATNLENELSEISHKTELKCRDIINDSTNRTEKALYKHLSLIEQIIVTDIDLAEQEFKHEAITLSYEIIKYLIQNKELENLSHNYTDLLPSKILSDKN